MACWTVLPSYLSLLLSGQLLLQLLQLLRGALTHLAVGGRQLVQLSLDLGPLLWGQSGGREGGGGGEESVRAGVSQPVEREGVRDVLAGLFGEQEDLSAPDGLGHLVLLGRQLFTDGLDTTHTVRGTSTVLCCVLCKKL